MSNLAHLLSKLQNLVSTKRRWESMEKMNELTHLASLVQWEKILSRLWDTPARLWSKPVVHSPHHLPLGGRLCKYHWRRWSRIIPPVPQSQFRCGVEAEDWSIRHASGCCRIVYLLQWIPSQALINPVGNHSSNAASTEFHQGRMFQKRTSCIHFIRCYDCF